jgi:tRNA U34 2-thiouridine synthase MnmA/TrmU
MIFRRIGLGLSGGVDSAVSAFLLKQKGFDVHAIYVSMMKLKKKMKRIKSFDDFR